MCQGFGYVLEKRGPNDRMPAKASCPRCGPKARLLKADPPESVDMKTAAKLLAGSEG
jgi:hypothetical protein